VKNLNDKIAIVTSANRGIGLEVVRQRARLGVTAILDSRELGKGEQAAAPMIADGMTRWIAGLTALFPSLRVLLVGV
jgi:NAD(P)-dependent dehydrogenase (short-subunit alcohol dehydrogenase family)